MLIHKRPPHRSTTLLTPCGFYLGNNLWRSSLTWAKVTCNECLDTKPRRGEEVVHARVTRFGVPFDFACGAKNPPAWNHVAEDPSLWKGVTCRRCLSKFKIGYVRSPVHKEPWDHSKKRTPCGALVEGRRSNELNTLWAGVTCRGCLSHRRSDPKREVRSHPRTTEKGGKNRSGRIPAPGATIHADQPKACASEAIHTWFELSYAQYLTVPRTALQSMPDEWQDKFVNLLNELDDRIDWRPTEGCYWVTLRGDDGRIRRDPLADYERGRRRLESRADKFARADERDRGH